MIKNFQPFMDCRQIFDKGLPGFQAQLDMCPSPRPGTRSMNPQSDCYQAGVMVLHYIREERPFLVLTLRTMNVANHRGQIAFPGGQVEAGETVLQAACRETREELGVTVRESDIAGALTPLYIPPSHYCIHPFVACLPEAPLFRPAPGEVEEIIDVPLDHLMLPSSRQREIRDVRGQPMHVPFFYYKGYRIWGATAMVLAEWFTLLQRTVQ